MIKIQQFLYLIIFIQIEPVIGKDIKKNSFIGQIYYHDFIKS